jgi:hypothetical protein
MRKQKWGCDEKNLSTRSEINIGAFYIVPKYFRKQAYSFGSDKLCIA